MGVIKVSLSTLLSRLAACSPSSHLSFLISRALGDPTSMLPLSQVSIFPLLVCRTKLTSSSYCRAVEAAGIVGVIAHPFVLSSFR
jgi:hypothetical protein